MTITSKTLCPLRFFNWKAHAVHCIAIVVLAVACYFSVLQMSASRHDVSGVVDVVVHPPRAIPALMSVSEPALYLQTLKQLPTLDVASRNFQQLENIANQHQLHLDKLTIDWASETGIPVRKASFGVTVQANEPQLLHFLQALKAALPNLVVEQMQFQRENAANANLQTDLQLALYFREPA